VSTPWYVPIARALPALVLAGVITFTPDHSAPLGLLTFGLFGVLSGAALVTGALRSASDRALQFVHGGLSILVGILALAAQSGGLPFLILLVTGWAAITGFLELYLGLRARRAGHAARDRIFVGALTALLALGVLLVPPGLAQPLGGIEGVEGVLTASVVVVGALGAYWAVLGVYLMIAGLSIKWAPDAAAAAPEGTNA
jgi:uncharacterized membrane protein HdeD (DUF308 family)